MWDQVFKDIYSSIKCPQRPKIHSFVSSSIDLSVSRSKKNQILLQKIKFWLLHSAFSTGTVLFGVGKLRFSQGFAAPFHACCDFCRGETWSQKFPLNVIICKQRISTTIYHSKSHLPSPSF